MDVADAIRRAGEPTNRCDLKKISIRRVRCQGCGEYIYSDHVEGVEWSRTKRRTDVFFHRGCMGKVWKRKIV